MRPRGQPPLPAPALAARAIASRQRARWSRPPIPRSRSASARKRRAPGPAPEPGRAAPRGKRRRQERRAEARPGSPGSGSPGAHCGPGPSPAAPAAAPERVVSEATQTYERRTEPAAAPGTGRSLLPGRLNPGTRTDFLPCLSPPCDGALPAPAPGRGRAGQRPPEPLGSRRDGAFLVRPAPGWEPVRSPPAVGQCLFRLQKTSQAASVLLSTSPGLSYFCLYMT